MEENPDASEGTSEGGRSTSGTPRGRQPLRLSPELERLAGTVIPFQAVVNLRRIEDEEAEEVARRAVLLPIELIRLGSLVLDILMSFLDEKSLKNCRQVCSGWEDAARWALMKQCGLNVQAFFLHVRPSEQNAVELYSSWIWEYKRSLAASNSKVSRAWTNFIRKWGKTAKSLTLRGLTLDANCRKWIRRLLCAWCPSVRELNLEFKEEFAVPKIRGAVKEFQEYLEDGDEGKFRQIWKVKKNHAFAPYPVFPNIQSLRVGKKSDEVTSFLSINILLSCPNLKNLFVSEQRMFLGEDVQGRGGKGGFRILDFLSKRPDISMKLETFEWQDDDEDACRSSSFHFDDRIRRNLEREINNARLNALLHNRPFLQFGNRLKTLHWNVLRLDSTDSHLFPGVLEQVAGNLRKLDLRMLRTRSGDSSRRPWGCEFLNPGGHLNYINYPLPSMPKLSIIQIGLRDCYQISLNELVDAARNLSTLEISACGCCDWFCIDRVHRREDPWEARPSEQPHNQLKYLKSERIPRNTESLQRIVHKFPNLEELFIGVESHFILIRASKLKLDGNDSIFHTLEQLNSLKRFHWKFPSGPVDIYEILAGFAEAGDRIMQSLESCHIHVDFVACPTQPEDAVERERFLADRAQLLEKILKTKKSACKFIVTATHENIFATKGEDRNWYRPIAFACEWKRLLLQYIKRHLLPIEFRYSSTDI
jgi:hypothetical protein